MVIACDFLQPASLWFAFAVLHVTLNGKSSKYIEAELFTFYDFFCYSVVVVVDVFAVGPRRHEEGQFQVHRPRDVNATFGR